MESYNLVKRVNLIRLGFHIGIGMFNIRDDQDGIQIIDDSINDIMIRIYKPENRTGLIPTIIFYHGGGYAIGSADILEPVSYRLAKFTNCQVIYIEYRLLPEISFPTYLDDSLSTTKYLIENNIKYNLDLNNLVLCGDSAGI
jgi:acetyl esterase